jgi:SPP1 family predicted phage head-tail adaptor
MRAGSLDELVEIQERVETKDAEGHESAAWRTVGRVWAFIEQLKAEERQEGATLKGLRSHRIRMRYRSDLTAKHRIKHLGRIFNVDAVMQGWGRQRETQAMAVQEE